MKWMSILLLSLFSLLAYSQEVTQYDVKPGCSEDFVKISDGFLDWCLDVGSLQGARIVSDDGVMIFWSKKKHMSIKTHTSKSWGKGDSDMTRVPTALLMNDYAEIDDPRLKDDLAALYKVLYDDTGYRETGVVNNGYKSVSIIFGRSVSYVFVTNAKNKSYLTQISVYGMSKEEILSKVIKGVLL
ncbi:hypothetical protein [Alkalimarinus coralli]|uniref:hypothetical protein n=1 Tax=Alkalimarinus coralli TaxID=2935863 RepID=UPI00202B2067|nr:hypothetical protein [Alkalimarinus coralli]